jgi:uncharacterized damage-inducible protein DinB
MRREDFDLLFDYNRWANRQLVHAAGAVPGDVFVAPPTVTYRGLRGTLVHALDVERSWRLRLAGEPREVWDTTLSEDDFPSAAAVAGRWEAEEADRRSWLDTLDDAALDREVDLGPRDRFPLAYFLIHIVTHSAQQRRDVATILEQAGHTPPEIEFLYFADSLRDPSPGDA